MNPNFNCAEIDIIKSQTELNRFRLSAKGRRAQCCHVRADCQVHLKNIYESGELIESATAEKISVVRHEGSREVNRSLQF